MNDKISKVYLLSACRTPFGRLNGQYRFVPAYQLAARLLSQLPGRYGIDWSETDEIILGNAVGTGGNLARLAALEAGIPETVPATTLDYQCGASLKALEYGVARIRAGLADMIIAGGAESCSTQPRRYYADNDPRSRDFSGDFRKAQFAPAEMGDPGMLEAAARVAVAENISRSDMDAWAVGSHQRAIDAVASGFFDRLLVSVAADDSDESVRKKVPQAAIHRAQPVPDGQGLITAGNASTENDGASVAVLVSERWLKRQQGRTGGTQVLPLAEIIAVNSIGTHPWAAALGPVQSVSALLDKTGYQLADIGHVEINEAFAVKPLAFQRSTGCDSEKINPLGGSLAFGHPFAATGTALLAHLAHNLADKNLSLGIVSMGVAGGQGISVLIRNPGHAA